MESSVIFTATGFFLWSYFLSSACFCLLAKSEAVFIWVNFLQHCKHGKLHIYQFISFMHVSVIYDLLTVDKFLKYYVINDMCSFVHVACIVGLCFLNLCRKPFSRAWTEKDCFFVLLIYACRTAHARCGEHETLKVVHRVI